MKQYTFKDGTKVIASSVEEAKAKHKVMTLDDEQPKVTVSKGNVGEDILKNAGFYMDDDYTYIRNIASYTLESLEPPKTKRRLCMFVHYTSEETACIGLFVTKGNDYNREYILQKPIDLTNENFKENLKKFIEKAYKIGKSFVDWK